MSQAKTYSSAGAFRRALEERLKRISREEHIDLGRVRRQVAFDRILARLFSEMAPPWVLKGGYALELRFKAARSTVDVDLTLPYLIEASESDSDAVVMLRGILQAATGADLGDWFEYRVGAATMDITAAPYGGARFPVGAYMDGRVFAKFHLDVAVGDVVIQPLEMIEGRDWLGFAGIDRPRIRLTAREQQFAEKVHAYTLPRPTPNSRVKDLVDMALLVYAGGMSPRGTLEALRLTFERRKTHHLPAALPAPPLEWLLPFRALAEECRIQLDLDSVFRDVQSFYGKAVASWRKEVDNER